MKKTCEIHSLENARADIAADGAFLGLLQQDIDRNPDCIEPIPSSLLSRMARLRAKAEKNRSNSVELLEG
ncbi:TPA: hypothetical protein ACV4NZ_000626 [Pseudomonas aeruginosa]|uniref:hypothetical protein n=1 Tax=Pseudomonas TaxID=286 RepID=UPI000F5496C7|nr:MULTISPECIES: hypothetical protein [Pseudomonas]EIU3606183.1 hypothetical protein [Pseudomonas aeruginosa]EIU3812331.1 hypothetical protein [Pseudomonas aeruginosa]EIU3818424.1 hypothetical protein [Pseudomonas aeruginosa]EKV2963713.1 hypothetical protein [Pseudomonas aeruginosa]EKV3143893.1 hypothetical protein [Pseudomonas aeruginosa]